MFGAFRPTQVTLGGLLWCANVSFCHVVITNLRFARKVPWKLSVTRKANARARLKKVDAVIEAIRASGVQCAALVSALFHAQVQQLMRRRCRPKHLSFPRNPRWTRGTNTLYSARIIEAIERVYTRCQSGLEWVSSMYSRDGSC
jgi:hypothetical protein